MSSKPNRHRASPGWNLPSGEKKKPKEIPAVVLHRILDEKTETLLKIAQSIETHDKGTRSQQALKEAPQAIEAMRFRIHQAIKVSGPVIREKKPLQVLLTKAIQEFKNPSTRTSYLQPPHELIDRVLLMQSDTCNWLNREYDIPENYVAPATPPSPESDTADSTSDAPETPTPTETNPSQLVLDGLGIPKKDLPQKMAVWVMGLAVYSMADFLKSLRKDPALKMGEKISHAQIKEILKMFLDFKKFIQEELDRTSLAAPLTYETAKMAILDSLPTFEWDIDALPQNAADHFQQWILDMVQAYLEEDELLAKPENAAFWQSHFYKLTEIGLLENLLPEKIIASGDSATERLKNFPLLPEEQETIRERAKKNDLRIMHDIAKLLNNKFHGGIPLRKAEDVHQYAISLNLWKSPYERIVESFKKEDATAPAPSTAPTEPRPDDKPESTTPSPAAPFNLRIAPPSEPVVPAAIEPTPPSVVPAPPPTVTTPPTPAPQPSAPSNLKLDEAKKQADEALSKAELERAANQQEQEHQHFEALRLEIEQARREAEGAQQNIEEQSKRIEAQKLELQAEHDRLHKQVDSEWRAIEAQKHYLDEVKKNLENREESLAKSQHQLAQDRTSLESEKTRFATQPAAEPSLTEAPTSSPEMTQAEQWFQWMQNAVEKLKPQHEFLKFQKGLLAEVQTNHALRNPPLQPILDKINAIEAALEKLGHLNSELQPLLCDLSNNHKHTLIIANKITLGDDFISSTPLHQLENELDQMHWLHNILTRVIHIAGLINEIKSFFEAESRNIQDSLLSQINRGDHYFDTVLSNRIFKADPLALLGPEHQPLFQVQTEVRQARDRLVQLLADFKPFFSALEQTDLKKFLNSGMEEKLALALKRLSDEISIGKTSQNAPSPETKPKPKAEPRANAIPLATAAANPVATPPPAPATQSESLEALPLTPLMQLRALQILTFGENLKHPTALSMQDLTLLLNSLIKPRQPIEHTDASRAMDDIAYGLKNASDEGPTPEQRGSTGKLLIRWKQNGKTWLSASDRGFMEASKLPEEQQLTSDQQSMVLKTKKLR